MRIEACNNRGMLKRDGKTINSKFWSNAYSRIHLNIMQSKHTLYTIYTKWVNRHECLTDHKQWIHLIVHRCSIYASSVPFNQSHLLALLLACSQCVSLLVIWPCSLSHYIINIRPLSQTVDQLLITMRSWIVLFGLLVYLFTSSFFFCEMPQVIALLCTHYKKKKKKIIDRVSSLFHLVFVYIALLMRVNIQSNSNGTWLALFDTSTYTSEKMRNKVACQPQKCV